MQLSWRQGYGTAHAPPVASPFSIHLLLLVGSHHRLSSLRVPRTSNVTFLRELVRNADSGPHNQHLLINQIPMTGAHCYRSQKMKPFSIVVRSAGLEARETHVQIPALPLSTCVASSKLPTSLGPSFPECEVEMIHSKGLFWSCDEIRSTKGLVCTGTQQTDYSSSILLDRQV